MSKIVGIQFKDRGKVCYLDSGHFVLKKGDKVIIITEDGPAIGSVCANPQNREASFDELPLKKIFRLATEEEIETYERNRNLEENVFKCCYKKIKEKSLPMCLVCVERRFDGSKVVVYFTADGRVDFRELVKELVRKFRMRIEMRQISVRHQAKMVGGLGSCGRSLCCATFLNNFAPVTIKMAKEQNISLNPAKISGMCGRLMCCLAYEHEYYEKIKKKLPRVGKKVMCKYGAGKIIRQNILKESLTIVIESGGEVEVRSRDLVVESFSKEKSRKE